MIIATSAELAMVETLLRLARLNTEETSGIRNIVNDDRIYSASSVIGWLREKR